MLFCLGLIFGSVALSGCTPRFIEGVRRTPLETLSPDAFSTNCGYGEGIDQVRSGAWNCGGGFSWDLSGQAVAAVEAASRLKELLEYQRRQTESLQNIDKKLNQQPNNGGEL